MMRFLAVSTMFISAAIAAAACGDDGNEEQETLCDPGALIFCKCRGGGAGTKQCNSAGDGFDACISDATLTECEEVPDPTATGTGTSTGTGTASGTSTGTGMNTDTGTGTGTFTGNPNGFDILTPCSSHDQCKSGFCPMGYCTGGCESYLNCTSPAGDGDCVSFPGLGPICVPYCTTGEDCNPYGSPPSFCGYTLAVDNFELTACGDWGDPPPFPPDTWQCDDDVDCNFGYTETQRVCVFGQCNTGCYSVFDCPIGFDCSASGGNPGTCFQ